ncbi:TonB-dependent receptor [Algoriphagus kandeliae]|uniref:TonB-dependent receptor n=1 Tax=Algoriphagus kandeliae TaxID=2562278 RepID=A0A4Y9QUZ6_9BACT|nr:TonB-dependent receptor [Algoriphagus kandeliae]TFV95950.1 TonB-dependent receptor [Algoriphagus kandeliae]
MKLRVILFFYFFLSQFLAFGQTILKGRVLDEQGKGLPGVNIYIKGSYDGTTSGTEGDFSFQTTQEGIQILAIRMMGFKSQEQNITCDGGELQLEDFKLVELITEMNGVTISAGAMEASDEKKSVILRPLDIVTTPSAMGDIVGALQTLPGTSTVGNDGRLFVRGGDASEVGIYIDGMRVGNAYGTTAGNVPTRTRFNPNLFKGTFFSTGGYSAEYGQALSSALALNTKDLSVRKQGDLSLMSVGGGYSQTWASEKQSLTLSGNYFDLGPYQQIIPQDFDFERAPFGWDLEVAAQKKLKNGGLWKVLARTESGGMKLWDVQPGSENRGTLIDLTNRYSYAQTNWKKAGKSGWTWFAGAAISSNLDEVDFDTLQTERDNKLAHLKASAVKDFSDRISMKIGVEHFIHRYAEGLPQINQERDFLDNQSFLYTEWDWYLSRKLVLRGGLRAGKSSLNSEEWLDPRFSLAYQLSPKGQLSLAAGKFSQLPVETYRVLTQDLKNTESNHLILNYLWQSEGITFRAEAFYKSYQGLIRFDGTVQNPENLRNEGEGFARGLDFFFRDQKSIKNTDYWITYSFVDSKRSFEQFASRVQPGFAPRHNFSVVVKHFVAPLKSQLGASFSFNDGYAYTDPNFPGEMNRKTPGFQNLSLSWSYLPKPNLIIHAGVTNVLGRENVFGYDFAGEPNSQGIYESRAIGQAAPRFLFLGIFLTLSQDKNANQLNNL